MDKRSLALLFYLGLLAGLTLWPQEAADVDSLSFCILCGRRGLADAVLNVAMFLPLGLLLGRRHWIDCIVWAVLLSAGIEVAQLAVPGRHTNPVDAVLNTIGALAGFGLGRTTAHWIHPTRQLGNTLGTIAALLAGSTLPMTSWLVAADLPDPPYRVEWKTRQPGLVPYPGTVLAGTLGTHPLLPGPVGGAATVQALLERGALLRVQVEAGRPPEGLAPVLALYDGLDRAVALLAVDSTHVVYRQHTRASSLKLDNPDVRARGALDGVAPGDTVQLATHGTNRHRCFSVGTNRSCGPGVRDVASWRLLYALNGAPPEIHAFLTAAWLALLLFPVGYWPRWQLGVGLAACVGAYVWLRTPTGLGGVTTVIDLCAIALGVLLGILARRFERRQARAEAAPTA